MQPIAFLWTDAEAKKGWMGLDRTYIASQILAVIGLAALAMSYICKKKKNALVWCALYAFFYGGQYLLLRASAGFAICMIEFGQSVWFWWLALKERKNGVATLAILCAVYVLTGIFMVDGLISFAMVAGAIAITYAMWQDNMQVYGIVSLPVCLVWIAYNVIVRSIVGILSETVVFCFVIAGLIRRRKDAFQERLTNENEPDTIAKKS